MRSSRSSRRARPWLRLLRGAAGLVTLAVVGRWVLKGLRARRRAAVPPTGAVAAPSDTAAQPAQPAQPSGWAGLRRLATIATTLSLLTLWALTLRPDGLGGPAAYVFVSGTSMEPGLSTGDLVVARRQESYDRGDVVAYRVPGSNALVIHRIVGGSAQTGYKTRGDNRGENDLWTPKPDDIRGRQVFTVPRGGEAVALLGQPLPLAFLAGVLAFTSVGGPLRRS